MIVNTLKLKKKIHQDRKKKCVCKSNPILARIKMSFQLLTYFDPSCILLCK
ncbi:hypothetical protein HanIR_Chr08g0344761 [Helianthus annuus]|nr:hypothetical protein HanIR_Chr08g0344761 [Helianthus annuus]